MNYFLLIVLLSAAIVSNALNFTLPSNNTLPSNYAVMWKSSISNVTGNYGYLHTKINADRIIIIANQNYPNITHWVEQEKKNQTFN